MITKNLIPRLVLILMSVVVYETTYAQDNLTIYLFRHAEKTSDGRDPGLNEEGKQRAQTLFQMITEKEITGLYSTPFKRTQQTIAQFSSAHGLEVQEYDYRDLQGFADTLKTLTGVYLISGHSNTTPALTGFLTGMEISPINEDEYDNLFIVQFVDGKALLTILNYPPFYEGQ